MKYISLIIAILLLALAYTVASSPIPTTSTPDSQTLNSSSEPTTVEGWNAKGQALYSQGKYDEAIFAYGNALGLSQNDAVAWRNMGAAYEAKGDIDKAIQFYEKAVTSGVPDEEALRAKISELANSNGQGVPVSSSSQTPGEMIGQNQNPGSDAVQNCSFLDYSKLYKQEVGRLVFYTDSSAMRQGTYMEYYDPNRTLLKSTGCYLNDKKSGHWIFWSLRGNWPNLSVAKSDEGDYKDGMKNGRWIGWNNDIKVYEGDFKDGKEDGHWITYWPISGNKSSEGDYKNGMHEGHWMDWFDSGKIWHEGDYRDNNQVGNWTSWHEDGSIDFSHHYPL